MELLPSTNALQRLCFRKRTKNVAISGNISIGKSFLIKNLTRSLNPRHAMAESTLPPLNSVNLSKTHDFTATYPSLAKFVGKSKCILESYDQETLQHYYEAIVYKSTPAWEELAEDVKKIKAENIGAACFETQISFLSARVKSFFDNKLSFEGLIIDDRSLLEDLLFAYMQWKVQGLFNDRQYRNYRNFFEMYAKVMPLPDLFVVLKASPQKCYDNLQKRIQKNKVAGLNTDGEELITLQYLKDLDAVYAEWIKQLKKMGHKVVEVDYENYQTTEYMLKIINDNL